MAANNQYAVAVLKQRSKPETPWSYRMMRLSRALGGTGWRNQGLENEPGGLLREWEICAEAERDFERLIRPGLIQQYEGPAE